MELIRQAHNRLLDKANENVANQRICKFFKRCGHEIRLRGPPVKISPPSPFNPVLPAGHEPLVEHSVFFVKVI